MLSLLMYRIAASSPPTKPHSALEITLSNEEAITLAPESTALARVVKAEVIVGASNVGENVIYESGQHANFGRRDKRKGLTVFDVLGTGEGRARHHSKLDLLERLALDSGAL